MKAHRGRARDRRLAHRRGTTLRAALERIASGAPIERTSSVGFWCDFGEPGAPRVVQVARFEVTTTEEDGVVRFGPLPAFDATIERTCP